MPQRWDAGGRGVRQEDEGGQRPTIEIPLEAHRDGLERKVKQNTETAARDGRCFGLTDGFSHRFGPWHRPLGAVVFHTADPTKLELTDCSPHDGKLTCLRSTSARTRFVEEVKSRGTCPG